MVCTRRKGQQNKRIFSQLDEYDTDFLIAQSNHEAEVKNRTNMVDRGFSSNNVNGLIQVNSPQMDIHTLEENVVSKIRGEEDSVMKTVEIRV